MRDAVGGTVVVLLLVVGVFMFGRVTASSVEKRATREQVMKEAVAHGHAKIVLVDGEIVYEWLPPCAAKEAK